VLKCAGSSFIEQEFGGNFFFSGGGDFVFQMGIPGGLLASGSSI